MSPEIFFEKDRYNNIKSEVLSDFNIFFNIDESGQRCSLKGLDITFNDDFVNTHAFIKIETPCGSRDTETYSKIWCYFLNPNTLNDELACFYFYPKHARILLGKEDSRAAVILERANRQDGEFNLKMLLRNLVKRDSDGK